MMQSVGQGGPTVLTPKPEPVTELRFQGGFWGGTEGRQGSEILAVPVGWNMGKPLQKNVGMRYAPLTLLLLNVTM